MTDQHALPATPLDRLWLTEAVRLREEHAGPLDDDEANRQARTGGGELAERIQRRALWLARRDGLLEAQCRWHRGARLAGALLLLLAVLSGAGLALGALGDGQRPVNLFWALGSLLGLHLLTLCGWLLGLLLPGGGQGALGRLWLRLSAALARDARAAHLAPALWLLLQRHRLGRWWLGLWVHGVWSVALGSTLLALLALLATRRYGFVWETTLLSEETFVAAIRAVGALPALLGFDLPTPAQIRAGGQLGGGADSARQVWAGWLIGAFLTYGLLPRLLLALLCLLRWRRGRSRLRLETDLPAYRLLGERLQPSSERLGIRDAAPAQLHAPTAGARPQAHGGALLVAVELVDYPWPPPLPPGVAEAGILDDRAQRKRLLEQLAQQPPVRLAIACDPRRSPDRGTLALLGELSRCAAATRVWLLPAPPGEPLDEARLGDWRAALTAAGLVHVGTAPLDWLAHGDG